MCKPFKTSVGTAIVVLLSVKSYGIEIEPNALLLDGRIVGGQDTTIRQHPYHVSVRYRLFHTCGGTIIKNDVILTAAHCTDPKAPPFQYSIQFGVTTLGFYRNIIPARRLLRHENFNESSFDYDIALIYLLIRIPYTLRSKPIALASEAPEESSAALAIGWGTLTEGGKLPRVLQQVQLQIISVDVCSGQYKDLNTVTPQMICAGVEEGGKDSCQGDSGGPLLVNGQQVGIVSWGYGCARKGYAGVYSNLAQLHQWVVEKSGSNLGIGW